MGWIRFAALVSFVAGCSGPVDESLDVDDVAAALTEAEARAAVASACPCDGPWSGHQQYVQCVTDFTRDLRANGDITQGIRRAINRDARQSDCGRGCGGAGAGTFRATGALTEARGYGGYVQLSDGRLLIAGGHGASSLYLSSVEIYDRQTEQFTSVGNMGEPRARATASLLPDGRVLIAGGQNQTSDNLASTEIFNPATNTITPGPRMNAGRTLHTATTLTDGRVLLAGGFGSVDGSGANIPDALSRHFNSFEIYNPATNSFTSGTMINRRSRHSAARLPDGRVLIAGGSRHTGTQAIEANDAEVFNPATGTCTATAPMSGARRLASISSLNNGQTFVIGGNLGGAPTAGIATVQRYRPNPNNFTNAASLLNARGFHSADLLATGELLIAGGFATGPGLVQQAELFDGNSFRTTGSLLAGREGHAHAVFSDGTVVVAGGGGAAGILQSAELYRAVCP